MKQYAAIVAFIACATQITTAQTYGLGNTNPEVFSAFNIPMTYLSALWVNSNLNYYSQNDAVLFVNGPHASEFTSNLQAFLSPQYLLLEESDNRYLRLNVIASGTTNQQYTKIDGGNYGPPGSLAQSQNSLAFSLDGAYRDYDGSGNMFWSINTVATFNMSANYGDGSANYPTTSYYGAKFQDYSFGLGVGVGKMRNVTAVISAIRFQQRLKQLNLLNGDLSEGSIEDLAQQFYREGYYGEAYVRPDKLFWQKIQNALAGDGVSLAGLNQYADSYLREVPNELRFMRTEGVVGGAQLQMQYSNQFQTTSPGVRNLAEAFYTLGNIYAQYSHQLNLNSQKAFGASLSGGPNIVRDSQMKQQYAAEANVAYDYELTDRIVLSAYEVFSLEYINMAVQARSLSDNIGTSVNYFIEDKVSLSASYSWNYFDNKNYVAPVHGETIDNSVKIGVTYYINRGLIYN
jgi:hypothetical protein